MSVNPIVPPKIDMSDIVRQIADITGITSGIFSTGDRDFLRVSFADRRYFPLTGTTTVPPMESPDIVGDIARLMKTMTPRVPELKFVASDLLTVTVEDWSEVRSHGRAARRRRQGHRQRIRYVVRPDPKLYSMPDGTTVGHSDTINAAMRVVQVEAWKRSERITEKLLWGKLA